MRTELLLLPLLALGCAQKADPELIRTAVKDAFTQANPPGRTGLLLGGKAVWLEAGMFEDACLEQKDLAFNDEPAKRPANMRARISPTYQAQRWLTASTPKGYCVYIGNDPVIDVGTPVDAGDRFKVDVKLSMGTPTPWFECLKPAFTQRTMDVFVVDGEPRFEGDVTLGQGDCPQPLPEGEERTARKRPTQPPPKPPTKADVKSLAQRVEDAFYSGDFLLAQDLTSCYNLFEKDRYGTCSVGEFLGVGPSLHGEQRTQDGTPWLEYTISKLDDIGAITKDRKDPTLFHVNMTHKRTGSDRSFAVQWVGGQWKMVGVVGVKGEALTVVRYVYDLHRSGRRDIFQRRLDGEELDEQGNPPEGVASPF